MKGRRVVITLVVLAVIAGLVVAEIATSGSGSEPGKPAPALPSQVLSGPRETLASLRGKPAFINFWASWCDPCKQEAPELEAFSKSLHGRATLVGVDWGDAESNARQFISEHHLTYPILRDPSSEVGTRYGLEGLPTTYVLDAQGRIQETLRGPQTTETLNRALASVR